MLQSKCLWVGLSKGQTGARQAIVDREKSIGLSSTQSRFKFNRLFYIRDVI
jgi:hypothetical protein